MPISQDRMLSLLAIVDQCLAARELLCKTAAAELDEATTAFWATDISHDERANALLSHVQSLESAILDNPTGLSQSNIATLAREREHFRTHKSRNAIAARSMARRRARNKEAAE